MLYDARSWGRKIKPDLLLNNQQLSIIGSVLSKQFGLFFCLINNIYIYNIHHLLSNIYNRANKYGCFLNRQWHRKPRQPVPCPGPPRLGRGECNGYGGHDGCQLGHTQYATAERAECSTERAECSTLGERFMLMV